FIFRLRTRGLPRFVSPDTERPGIRRQRRALGAEETLADVPPAFRKLRGAEGNVDAIRIVEDCVVISEGVAIVGRAALSPASRGGLQRVRLKNPVTNINDVNILFHDDIPGEDAVIHPVAQTMFG